MITVLMPVYNGATTLVAAVQSVLGQEMGEFELLIVDDCSTDDSAQVIRTFEAADARVRAVYHGENIGLSATLNEGLETARFDLVARMDQDDECLPHRLSVQLEFMERSPEVVASGSWVYHMGAAPELDRLIRLPSTPEEIRRRLPVENCIYHPAVMLRREPILGLGGYRQGFLNAEDYDLWLRAMDVHALANVPEPLLRYRLSVGGMTLARKWEQLYYVFLAQAANQATAGSFERAEARASYIMSLIDKRAFLHHVVRDTSEQLALLGWENEARVLEANFGGPQGAQRPSVRSVLRGVHPRIAR